MLSLIFFIQDWKSSGSSHSGLFQRFEDFCRVLDDLSIAISRQREVASNEEPVLQTEIDNIEGRLSLLPASTQQ